MRLNKKNDENLLSEDPISLEEKVDNNVTYIEYLKEQLDKYIAYNDYLSEKQNETNRYSMLLYKHLNLIDLPSFQDFCRLNKAEQEELINI